MNIANLRQRSEIGQLKIQIVEDKKEIENCRNHLEKVFRVDVDKKDEADEATE